MNWTKLPSRLSIIKPSPIEYVDEATSSTGWMNEPQTWDKEEFLHRTKKHLFKQNGQVDLADLQLVGMLASQIEIYVKSMRELERAGLVINFNNGVTVGPNPHMTIADKAINRVIQIMKELELSPKARAAKPTPKEISPELKRLLAGP